MIAASSRSFKHSWTQWCETFTTICTAAWFQSKDLKVSLNKINRSLRCEAPGCPYLPTHLTKSLNWVATQNDVKSLWPINVLRSFKIDSCWSILDSYDAKYSWRFVSLDIFNSRVLSCYWSNRLVNASFYPPWSTPIETSQNDLSFE